MGQSARFVTSAAGWGSRRGPDAGPRGQAVGADDEDAHETLHASVEGCVALSVVGTGALDALPHDGGAVGAGKAGGVGDCGVGHHDASRSGGNTGQSSCRQPLVAGLWPERQSWWMARLQRQYQMPLMTVVSSSRSTTGTARPEPQPQRISWNWWAVGPSRNCGCGAPFGLPLTVQSPSHPCGRRQPTVNDNHARKDD